MKINHIFTFVLLAISIIAGGLFLLHEMLYSPFTEINDVDLIQKVVGVNIQGATSAYCLESHNQSSAFNVVIDFNQISYDKFVKNNHFENDLRTDQDELSQRLEGIKRGFVIGRAKAEALNGRSEDELEGFMNNDLTWVSTWTSREDKIRRVYLVKYDKE